MSKFFSTFTNFKKIWIYRKKIFLLQHDIVKYHTMNKTSPFAEKNRLRKMESPDGLQDYVRVTSVSPLLIGCAIFLLLCAFVVWGMFGTVTDRVEFSGLIFPHHGTDDVVVESHGTITKMLVHTGDTVMEGQNVAHVLIDGKDSLVCSKLHGTVLFTKQDRETFDPMEPLVSMVCDHHQGGAVHTMLVAYVDMDTQHYLREDSVSVSCWHALSHSTLMYYCLMKPLLPSTMSHSNVLPSD